MCFYINFLLFLHQNICTLYTCILNTYERGRTKQKLEWVMFLFRLWGIYLQSKRLNILIRIESRSTYIWIRCNKLNMTHSCHDETTNICCLLLCSIGSNQTAYSNPFAVPMGTWNDGRMSPYTCYQSPSNVKCGIFIPI